MRATAISISVMPSQRSSPATTGTALGSSWLGAGGLSSSSTGVVVKGRTLIAAVGAPAPTRLTTRRAGGGVAT